MDVIYPTTTEDTIEEEEDIPPPRTTFHDHVRPFYWIITITLLCLLFWILMQYHVKLRRLERALDAHQRALDRLFTRLDVSSPDEIFYQSHEC